MILLAVQYCTARGYLKNVITRLFQEVEILEIYANLHIALAIFHG